MNSNMFPMLFDMLAEQIRNDLLSAYHRAYKDQKQDAALFECQASFYAGGVLNSLREWMKKYKCIDEEEFIRIISKMLVTVV